MVTDAQKLNSDIYLSDFEFLNQVIAELALSSRKDGLHEIFNRAKGTPSTVNQRVDCGYLSDDGLFCCRDEKKIKKTTNEQCKACQKAKKLAERDHHLAEIRRAGVRFRTDAAERVWRLDFGVPASYDRFYGLMHIKEKLVQKDKEIEELKKPNEERLTEIDNLKKECERLAPLETDNAFLRQEIEKLRHEPLAEKNAYLTIELGRRDEEIQKLKGEVENQEKIINAYMFRRQAK